MRKLIVLRYDEFLEILKREGDNVFSVGIEWHDYTEYFRIMLRQ